MKDTEHHEFTRSKSSWESSILMIDEKMINDPLNGSGLKELASSFLPYQKGKYHFIFNSNKIEKDGVVRLLEF